MDMLLDHQQGGGHPAAFVHEDIIGAAGRAGIHYLDADAFFKQARGEGGRGETQSSAASQQHHFRPQLQQNGEVPGAEIVKMLRRPVSQDQVGQNDAALGEHFSGRRTAGMNPRFR